MIVFVAGPIVQSEVRHAILVLAQLLEPEPVAPTVERVLFTDGPTCMVCLEAHDTRPVASPCGHCFHEACIVRWAEQSRMCPVCRADLA